MADFIPSQFYEIFYPTWYNAVQKKRLHEHNSDNVDSEINWAILFVAFVNSLVQQKEKNLKPTVFEHLEFTLDYLKIYSPHAYQAYIHIQNRSTKDATQA